MLINTHVFFFLLVQNETRRLNKMGTTRAGLKTVGGPGQDIFRGDFFPGGGGGNEAPFGGGPFGGWPSLPCPKI